MWNTTQLTDSLKSFYSQRLEQAEQIGGKLGERANELTERFDVRDRADKLTEKLGIRQNAAALAERVSEKLPPESKIVIASKKVLDWAESQTAKADHADADSDSKNAANADKAANSDKKVASTTKTTTKKPAGKETAHDAGNKKPATKKASASSASKKASMKTAGEVTQIVAAEGGSWVVKRSDSDHVTYRTESKEAAVTRAARIAQNNGRKLVVIDAMTSTK
jgi:hypothetical protein